MEYFKIRQNVDVYTKMMSQYDNSFVISEIKKILPKGLSLLELGMGTGLDLIELSKDYNVIGSDSSHLFIDDFKNISDIKVMILDAVDFNINQKFDCIYSNKVLQHLSNKDFLKSLQCQSEHLSNNGIIFSTLWSGEYKEEFMFDGQLRFIYYNKAILEKLIPKELGIFKIIYYSEFEANDSLIMVLKRK